MNILSFDEFKKDFRKVILSKDEVVLVYSGVWTFGHLFRRSNNEVVKGLLDSIEEVVGARRTLIFPTYTFDYTQNRRFHLKESKPETGCLPEQFLYRDGVHRTHSAINSFAAKGPLARLLIPLTGDSTWGKGSPFEWFDSKDIRVVTLGLPWHITCGYFHRIEEVAQVPYRFYKEFPGVFIDENETSKPWCERMFVRSLSVPSELDWSKISLNMEKKGEIIKNDRPGLLIESARAHSILLCGLDVLKSDPYALVRNRDEVIQWVENGGKKMEIEMSRTNSMKGEY